MALLAFGIVLLPIGELAPSWSWVSVPGATLFGAGIATLLSFAAAQYSTLEGYRKEANLTRKETLYGPLYIELKQLRERVEDAQNKNASFPQRIDIQGEPISQPIMLSGASTPTLNLWPQFRSDYRIDSFSPEARRFLNEVLQSASTYNSAIQAIRPVVTSLLKDQIREVVSQVTSNPEYIQWRSDHQEQILQHVPFRDLLDLDDTHKIYAAVAYGTSYPDTPVEDNWSHVWLENLGGYLGNAQPETLGWLLANRPDCAASVVYDVLIRSGTHPAVAPLSWYTEIFTQVCNSLAAEAGAMTVYTVAEGLLRHVEKAEQKLADGLDTIRERYEGGAPLV